MKSCSFSQQPRNYLTCRLKCALPSWHCHCSSGYSIFLFVAILTLAGMADGSSHLALRPLIQSCIIKQLAEDCVCLYGSSTGPWPCQLCQEAAPRSQHIKDLGCPSYGTGEDAFLSFGLHCVRCVLRQCCWAPKVLGSLEIFVLCVCVFSHVQLFVTPGLEPTRLLYPWKFSGKNTGVGCHALLQGVFPTQGSNLLPFHLLHWWWILYHRATWEARRVLVLFMVFLLLMIQTCTKGTVLGTEVLSLDLWVSGSLFSSDSWGQSCSLGLPEKGTPSIWQTYAGIPKITVMDDGLAMSFTTFQHLPLLLRSPWYSTLNNGHF